MGKNFYWYADSDADDFIFASSRWSKIFSGDGDDTIFANGGRDTIWAGDGDDIVYGGRRRDVLHGGQGDDELHGGNGRDRLYGGDGADDLYGGNGHDTLFGGEGDDRLTGGRGNDDLRGGAGFDIAVFRGGLDDYLLTDLGQGRWKITAHGDVSQQGTDIISGIEALYFIETDAYYFFDTPEAEYELVDDHFQTYANQTLVFDLDRLFDNDVNADGVTFDFVEVSTLSDRGVRIEIVDGTLLYHVFGEFDDLVQDAVLDDAFQYTLLDDTGKTHIGHVKIDVIGVNDAPQIQSETSVELWENTTFVTDITVRDPEWDDVTVEVLQTGDGAYFSYDADRRELVFTQAPDFEAPQDHNGDNLYHVTLQATDFYGAVSQQTIDVRVKDATEISVQPRINEIHYDDIGMDNDEFVEVRVENGYDMSDLAVLLYNGKAGYRSVYDTITAGPTGLQLVSTDDTYDYYVWNAPMNGIQNGSPDGFALVEGGDVIEFLSIEGTFIAADGTAAGMMSHDIGVQEYSDTIEGVSLQRLEDDTWIGPLAHTNGYANLTEADMLM